MTRHLDAVEEERQTRKYHAVVRALEFELQGVIAGKGGQLTGFSVTLREWECLITLRSLQDGVPSVAFVGSDTLVNCVLKAVHSGQRDKLVWRVDKYAK